MRTSLIVDLIIEGFNVFSLLKGNITKEELKNNLFKGMYFENQIFSTPLDELYNLSSVFFKFNHKNYNEDFTKNFIQNIQNRIVDIIYDMLVEIDIKYIFIFGSVNNELIYYKNTNNKILINKYIQSLDDIFDDVDRDYGENGGIEITLFYGNEKEMKSVTLGICVNSIYDKNSGEFMEDELFYYFNRNRNRSDFVITNIIRIIVSNQYDIENVEEELKYYAHNIIDKLINQNKNLEDILVWKTFKEMKNKNYLELFSKYIRTFGFTYNKLIKGLKEYLKDNKEDLNYE